MTRNREDALIDLDLERAMAAEAVFSFERYIAYGVTPEDYAYPQQRAVVEAAHASWQADGAVSVGTVAKWLQRAGKLDSIGGQRGLSELLTSFGVPDADKLRELRRLRSLRDAGVSVAKQASAGDLHAALAALSEAQSSAIDARSASEPETSHVGVSVLLESLAQNTRANELVHPGLEIMQEAMGSLPLGGLTVLGGATNTGKSSVILEMLINASERNVGCGYISCEDHKTLVYSRLLGAYSGVSARKIVQGQLSTEEWSAVTAASHRIQPHADRQQFAYPVGGNEIDVCAAMSKLAMRGCRLLFVDYVQAIESSKRQQDRRNEIRWLCARLKEHAQRLNVHLVLASQFARPGKGDEFKEPSKYDLKEAGDLENAADYIVLLWRESTDDFAPLNIKLEKSKFGNLGARWQMVRRKGARLCEVSESYVSAAARRQREGR